MASTVVAQKAMGIAKNLVSSSKKFLGGITSTRRSTVEATGSKIQSTTQKIKNENLRQRRFEKNTVESQERRSRENKVEVVKPAAIKIVDVAIKKPLASFWKLVLAWVIDNLPKILKEVEIFTKKVRVFAATVKAVITKTGTLFRSLGKVFQAFVNNVKEMDFTDKSGRIAIARQELDTNMEEIRTSMDDLGEVWSMEEEELDRALKEFESDKNAEKIQEEIQDQFRDEIEPVKVAVPKTPVVGAGSKETGTEGGYNRLLKFISKGEGGYNAMNQGTIGKKIVGSTNDSKTKIGKDLTSMTIGEVMKRQAYLMDRSNPQIGDYGIFAAGAYQIIPDTMPAALKFSGLTKKDLFNKKNQDKLGIGLINSIPAAKKYLSGESTDEKSAAKGLSKMWASIPDPDTNKSAYGSGNAAGHTSGETFSVLSDTRKDLTKPKPKAAAAEGTTKPSNVQKPTPKTGQVQTTVKDEFMGGKSDKIITSSKYGFRVHPISGAQKMHSGIDLAPPGPGYRVSLKVPGVVTAVRYDARGYGHFVIITSKQTGKSYMFAHLKTTYVQNGDNYTGQAIGEIGTSGGSTGIHLHYEVYIGGAYGKAIDPTPYINLISIGKQITNKQSAVPVSSNLTESKTVELDRISSVKTGGTQVVNNTTVLRQKEIVMVG